MSVQYTRGSKCRGSEVGVHLACLRYSRGQQDWRRISEGGAVEGEVTEVSRGERSCKTYQAMVRTLAFILSEMGARGGL